MTIELPDELGLAVTRLAEAEGFGSVADFIASQVEDYEPIEHPDPVELKRLLDEARASPVVAGDAAFWAERRRVLAEYIEAERVP